MAKIYPVLKVDRSNAPSVSSEKKAYAALAKNLNNDYIVFFSIDWAGKEAIHGSQDFECDFVIFHKEKGILIVEVKGGGIRYDEKHDTWESVNNRGTFKIKNPITQANKNKHALKKYIFENFEKEYNKTTPLRLAHCVWFIDTDVNVGIAPRANSDIILNRDSINRINEDIERAYKFFDDENNNRRMNPDDYQKIMALLLPKGEFQQTLVKNLEHGNKEIIELTNQQLKLLRNFRKQNRMFITGAAGTGKTLMGLEKARLDGETGKKVLYTCYSRPVSEYLASMYNFKNVEIINFHRLCHEYGKKIGKGDLFEKEENYNSSTFWSETSVSILEEAIFEIGEDAQYDSIILDEFQDFEPSWYKALEECVIKDPQYGTFYIVGDGNQTIFERDDLKDKLSSFFTFELSDNLRNTKQIFNVFSPFSEVLVEPQGPEGQAVGFIESNENNLEKLIEKEANKLFSQKVRPRDIVVLSGRKPSKFYQSLHNSNRFGTDIHNRTKVLLSTIHSFKGLESDIVFLTGLGKLKGSLRDNLIYVGCSRAKQMLFIIDDKEIIELIKNKQHKDDPNTQHVA